MQPLYWRGRRWGRSDLDVTTWTERFGIVQREDGVDQRSGEVTSPLTPFDDDLGDVLEDLRHILGFAHLYEANGSDDHPCRLRLAAADAAGAAIPLSALYQTGDTTGVYIIEDGAVHLQPVTVTAFRDNDAVVTGLPAGAVIVTAGVHQLHEGEKVRTQ